VLTSRWPFLRRHGLRRNARLFACRSFSGDVWELAEKEFASYQANHPVLLNYANRGRSCHGDPSPSTPVAPKPLGSWYALEWYDLLSCRCQTTAGEKL
jgi:hypothetical protein